MDLIRRELYLYVLGIIMVTPIGYIMCLIVGRIDQFTVPAVLVGASSFVVCDLLERYFPLGTRR